jgi:hypothetical protein
VGLGLRVAVPRVALGLAVPPEAVRVAEGEWDGLGDADRLELGDALLVTASVDWPAAAAPAGEDEAAGRMVAAEPLLGPPPPPLSPTMPAAATAIAPAPTNIRAYRGFRDGRGPLDPLPGPGRDEPVRRDCRREADPAPVPAGAAGSGSQTALIAGP